MFLTIWGLRNFKLIPQEIVSQLSQLEAYYPEWCINSVLLSTILHIQERLIWGLQLFWTFARFSRSDSCRCGTQQRHRGYIGRNKWSTTGETVLPWHLLWIAFKIIWMALKVNTFDGLCFEGFLFVCFISILVQVIRTWLRPGDLLSRLLGGILGWKMMIFTLLYTFILSVLVHIWKGGEVHSH